MRTKRYLKQSATETWRLASYQPTEPKAPKPPKKKPKVRSNRRARTSLLRG